MEACTAIKFLDDLHCFVCLTIIQRAVIRRNRSDKGLECHTALFIQSLQIIKVIRNQAAPEAIVYIRIRTNLGILDVKQFCIGQCRLILQRHVHDSRIAAYSSCSCTMSIILTPFVARIIQMCMGVNCAREYIIALCINYFCSFRLLSFCQNCCDFAILNGNVSTFYCLSSNDLTVFHQQIIHKPTSTFLKSGQPFSTTIGSFY